MRRKGIGRRKFVASMGVAAGGLLYGANPDVRRVLLMCKCHFDLGFIDTQAAVMRLYFQKHFPQAMITAAAMRRTETPYVWTTGSWLLYEYLEQAGPTDRKGMEEAIAAGDIAWHALPFSWQTELLDRSSISAMLGLSRALDARYGRTTTGAKMTDVPGHSRGLIGPLAGGGVRLLDIGVNSASSAPQVPELFVWRDPDGASLVVMYHRTDYGGIVQVPGSDLAVAIEVKNDNEGPHTPEEIRLIYARLRSRFPKARIRPASLSEIAEAVVPHQEALPVVTQEIGDTWIYGVPSDPVKVAGFRELQRLRREWLATGKVRVGDQTDLAFCRKFLLAAEHTWGTDTKTWLDFETYRPEALAAKLNDPRYKTVENSWAEKRENLKAAVRTIPADLRSEAEVRLQALTPLIPPYDPGLDAIGSARYETRHFTIQVDTETGAVVRLKSKASGIDWALPASRLGLFSYQTLSQADYDQFLAAYITVKTDWAPKDFGKPNMERFGAVSRVVYPSTLLTLYRKEGWGVTLGASLSLEDKRPGASGKSGMPKQLHLRIMLPDAEPVMQMELTWADKPATRMPEALWFTFQPAKLEGGEWIIDKVERSVTVLDVVPGGNRHMHAVTTGITYRAASGGLKIESLDAPVVALGERSPLAYSTAQPDMTAGVHFCLFNNAWGTNYVQWFGEDMKFRFALREA